MPMPLPPPRLPLSFAPLRCIVRVACGVSCFIIVTGAHDAAAQEAPEALPAPATSGTDFELGGAVGYTTPPIRGGTSPFGMGIGGRAGLAFASGVYVGLSVIDYLGSKDVDVTDTALLYGLDLGYGFRLAETSDGGKLTLRPQIGAGGLTVFRTDPSLNAATTPTSGSGRQRVDVVSSASGGSGGSSSNVTTVDAFYVEPAVTLMYATGAFFVALNPNILVVPGITYSGAAPSTWLSYGLQGQGGLRF
jgi:hypothetical protein